MREATEAATAAGEKKLHDSLLTLSQFLRLAAARRADDQNQQLDENLALEGVLLQVYAGDESGVTTMLKLVQGVEETTKGVSNEPLQTTCEFFYFIFFSSYISHNKDNKNHKSIALLTKS